MCEALPSKILKGVNLRWIFCVFYWT